MTEDQVFSTPMMQQYLQLKQEYADCILWFRLGDFYEMFLDHAEIGSRILGITLTARARGKDGRIPMAGVPYHAADTYLGKLVAAGYKVAICEQVSEPNGKGLVDREVVRIVTPGTILDEKSLDQKTNNYVLSLCHDAKYVGVALADVSTGEFRASSLSYTLSDLEATVSEIIAQFQPQELLVSPTSLTLAPLARVVEKTNRTCTAPDSWSRWANNAEYLRRIRPEAILEHDTLAGQAAAALLGYLDDTQKTKVKHLHSLSPLFPDAYLALDRSTITNLELFSPLHHRLKRGSLLAVLDQTDTAMGGRLLKQWLLKPLTSKEQIQQRLAAVAHLKSHTNLRSQLKILLKQIPDTERLLSRLSVGLGSPRDLINLAQALDVTTQVNEVLSTIPAIVLFQTHRNLKNLSSLVNEIRTRIIDLPPIDPRAGGVIQTGFNAELDKLRQITAKSREIIARLEQTERQKTGISSLKIKYNQVFGFYIEVSKANLSAVPDSYFRKQTLVNAERFITPELKEQEDIILSADDTSKKLEYTLFLETVQLVTAQTALIQAASRVIAQLDCLVSLAEVADLYEYVKPEIIETGEIFLTQSRHPVVEQLIEDQGFVPNDIYIDQQQQQIILLTGPNMAGKSVLMRQVALTSLMAQMGSFVPAEAAKISLVDRIFVRSGAADMITAGLSTFMVEMVETAYILAHTTPNSLIVMDEIGRGTSTYDGISLAWAIAEYLVKDKQLGPKTLFATHYHELQALAGLYSERIKNFHMAITEHHHKPVFLYTLTQGGASHSYGVAVAELAGLPEEVIHRAQDLVAQLEQHPVLQPGHIHPAKSKSSKKTAAKQSKAHPVLTKIKQTKLETLTPLEALNLLNSWKSELDDQD